MTPHLRTFIDAIESAAGKRDAAELTDMERVALCVSAGVRFDIETPYASEQHDGKYVDMTSAWPVEFVHDGGNWQVIELK